MGIRNPVQMPGHFGENPDGRIWNQIGEFGVHAVESGIQMVESGIQEEGSRIRIQNAREDIWNF